MSENSKWYPTLHKYRVDSARVKVLAADLRAAGYGDVREGREHVYVESELGKETLRENIRSVLGLYCGI